MPAEFPTQQPGVNYLTEGGQETEIMYKYGFDLPHFAMFPLLDNPRAVTELHGMSGRYLDTAAQPRLRRDRRRSRLRASPDWGVTARLFQRSLADSVRAIGFLRDVARPYEGRCPRSSTPASSVRAATPPRRIRRSPPRRRRTTTASSSPPWPCRGRSGRGHDLQWCAGGHRIVPRRGGVGLPLAVRPRSITAPSFNSVRSVKDAIETIDVQTG